MAWSKATRIKVMLGIDTAFFFLELVVGIAVQSLALMADAFHMLNDIISLVVGLWAVNAAQKSSSDKYSFGFLRAEILGASFNAVFLIALCLTIIMEAVGRLLEPPQISNPMLILIVGSLGLTSNVVGFFVLGGHGHSHGESEGHGHSHGDEVHSAEEGHNYNSTGYEHRSGASAIADDDVAGSVFPEALVAKANSRIGHRLRPTKHDEDASTAKDSNSTVNRSWSKSSSRNKHRRRTSGRFASIDDLSIHPASFRQEIIAASKPQLDGIESEENTGSEDDAVADEEDAPTEETPILSKSNGKWSRNGSHEHDHHEEQPSYSTNPNNHSWHAKHNHNKPKKPSKGGHGHSHGDMGMNAMILHVIGDMLGNVGVIIAALIIWLTSSPARFYADPIVSLFISLIILKSAIPLTKATAKILLQATPDHLSVQEIKEDIQDIPGVVSCHHVHIWQLSDTQLVASLHIQIAFPISEANGEKYMELAKAARGCLHAYGIHSATIQPEFCLDRDHNHNSQMGLDGIVGQPRCRMDDECLLGCVDDCEAGGCCAPAVVEEQHDHLEQDGHTH